MVTCVIKDRKFVYLVITVVIYAKFFISYPSYLCYMVLDGS